MLPLQGAQRFVQGHETWVIATASDRFLIPSTPRDALAEAIEYELSGAVEDGLTLRWLTVVEGGASAILDAAWSDGTTIRLYRANFGTSPPVVLDGLTRLAEISGAAVQAIANALRPSSQQPVPGGIRDYAYLYGGSQGWWNGARRRARQYPLGPTATRRGQAG